MARLPILEYPDPRLRIRAEPVTKVDAEIRQLRRRICSRRCMPRPASVWLRPKSMFTNEFSCSTLRAEGNEPYCLINPEIVSAEGHDERRGRLPVGARILRLRRSRRADQSPRARPKKASRSSSTRKVCSPSASSTRWITSMGSCSSITCPSSSASGSRRRRARRPSAPAAPSATRRKSRSLGAA